MPQHTPREAVIAASEQARAANADLIVTVGGGSITDGAKAVQLCLANDIRTVEGIDAIRAVKGAPPPMNAPSVRQISVPTTIAGGEFSASAGVTNMATKFKEPVRHRLDHAARGDPRSRHHPAYAGMAVPLDRDPRRRPLRRRHLRARGASLCRCAGAEGACDARLGAAAGEGKIRAISTRGWIARSAPGFRPARSLRACRWARATASAMCWAQPMACRMDIRRA